MYNSPKGIPVHSVRIIARRLQRLADRITRPCLGIILVSA